MLYNLIIEHNNLQIIVNFKKNKDFSKKNFNQGLLLKT